MPYAFLLVSTGITLAKAMHNGAALASSVLAGSTLCSDVAYRLRLASLSITQLFTLSSPICHTLALRCFSTVK